jgi:hypothetical protein
MSALIIKTGMSVENSIAEAYAAKDILKLTGAFTVDTLDAAVPVDAKAIISFGVCGGLSPDAQIGQAFIYSACVTPNGTFYVDTAWRMRLFAATKYYERKCWSSGEFNTANTVEERAKLFAQTECSVIDDETFAVAELAHKRGIAWIGLRTVSDGAEDNLPPAVVNALNPDGDVDIEAVLASVVEDPLQIPALLETAEEAQTSFDELRTAAIAIGPNFQWL